MTRTADNMSEVLAGLVERVPSHNSETGFSMRQVSHGNLRLQLKTFFLKTSARSPLDRTEKYLMVGFKTARGCLLGQVQRCRTRPAEH